MSILKILRRQFYQGPNLYSDGSALLVTTDFGGLLDSLREPMQPMPPAQAESGFTAHLAEVLAVLRHEQRSWPEGASTVDAMLFLADLLQQDYVFAGSRGRVAASAGNTLTAVVPAQDAELGLRAWTFAMAFMLHCRDMQGSAQAPSSQLLELSRAFLERANQLSLNMNLLAIVRRAIALDIPWYPSSFTPNRLQLGQGRHARLVQSTQIEPLSTFSVTHVRSKWATIQRLRQMGLPTLPSRVVASEEMAVAAAGQVGVPVAVKPDASDTGIGISLNLKTTDQVRRAWRIASGSGPSVLVERFADGDDHRMLVVDGNMIACAKRSPASVVGDDRSSIAELIEELNRDPRRGESYQKIMQKVLIDERLQGVLASQGLDLGSVPATGRQVALSLAANISQGGSAVDVTANVHPDNVQIAERAAAIFKLNVAGVDFLSADISKSWRDGDGWILEVNNPPGLRPHWLANPDHDVVAPIVRSAFPEGASARIPTAGVTGSIGKSTICQILAHIAREAGKTVGISTTQGIWSGEFRIAERDWSSGAAAARLLSDPSIDFGVFELARGALLKYGMVIDGVDVAAVLNVQQNHLGIDGLETREQLAAVKSIIVRTARRAAVLNADDPLVLAMRDLVKSASLTLVSAGPDNPAVVAHRQAGGCVAWLEGTGNRATIRLVDKRETVMEIPVAEIPATRNGRSGSVTANAAFALPMAYHLGLSTDAIRKGLSGFTSDVRQNPGRHNWIEGLPFELVLNWTDGAVALADMIETSNAEPAVGRRHVLLSSAGDRSDEWIRDIGRTAAGNFDRYYCASIKPYLRGRQPAEIPELLAEGLASQGVAMDDVVMLDMPDDPVSPVLEAARRGDRVVISLWHDFKSTMKSIEKYRLGSGTCD